MENLPLADTIAILSEMSESVDTAGSETKNHHEQQSNPVGVW
jgi:hypothetical protein